MNKKLKISLAIIVFIAITLVSYFIYIYNLDFRVVVRDCSDSTLESNEEPKFEIVDSKWDRDYGFAYLHATTDIGLHNMINLNQYADN